MKRLFNYITHKILQIYNEILLGSKYYLTLYTEYNCYYYYFLSCNY